MDLKNGMVRLPSEVAHLQGYASMGAPNLGAAASAYIDVSDGAGWTFRAFADGRLKIIDGPSGVGTVYTPGAVDYEQVLQRLRARDPRIDGILAATTVPQGSENASSFITGLLNQLGVGAGPGTSQAEASDPVAAQQQKGQIGQMFQSLLSQYGPGAATALQTAVANRTQSLDALMKKVAKKRAQYATATKPGKKAKLAAEIAGLEAQIRRLHAAQAQAQAQLQAPPPQARAALPPWFPYALGGGLLLLGAVALARK